MAAVRHNRVGGTSGVYELQLRRKLLQQQLSVVEQKRARVAAVVAKKHLAKLPGPAHQVPSYVGGDAPAEEQSHAQSHPYKGRRYGRGESDTHRGGGRRRARQELTVAAPFKKGGRIDHAHKKHMLQDKKKELQREETLEKSRRSSRHMADPRERVAVAPSNFPDRYLRGEVPCSKHCSAANALVWVCPLEQLDYDYYLPMFFDGIRCVEEPCKTLAQQGVHDLLSAARGHPERILPSLPSIMRAIRLTISSKDPDLLVPTCAIIRELASGNAEVGLALVKYYNTFLKVFNLFMNCTKSTGDAIDYGQRKSQDLGEAVSLTVEVLERCGGMHAFAYIKKSIPTYQSCLL